MQGKLGRRVVVFGRTIVVVWLLSAAAWLQKQDSCDLRDDVHDLKLMAVLDQIEPSADLQRLHGPAFQHALEWIAEHRPQIDGARVEVRTQFVEWLHERGVPQMEIGQFSGKMSAPAAGATPFRFISMQDLPAERHADDDESQVWLSDAMEQPSVGASYDSRPHIEERRFVVTVAHLLDELEQLTARRQIVCATAVDEQVLASINFTNPMPLSLAWELDSPRESYGQPGFDDFTAVAEVTTALPEPPDAPVYGEPAPGVTNHDDSDTPWIDEWQRPGPPRTVDANPMPMSVETGHRRARRRPVRYQEDLLFQSASLNDGRIEVRYEWMVDRGEMVQQMDQDAFMDRSRLENIPVKTTLIENAPSLLELSDPERTANGVLHALGTDTERVTYLRRAYGHMPLDEATGIASDGLTEAYRSLSLFGFRFSTRRFPLAVLLCLGAALWQTLAALVAIRRQQVGLLADIVDDATIEVLVSNRVSRFVLWVVMPLMALWTSLPLVPLPESEFQTLVFGAAVIGALGAACVGTVELHRTRRPLNEAVGAESASVTSQHAPHTPTHSDRRSRSVLP